ncbi:MAG: hypothetical protein HND57_07090 [Planctomycetes bacterium]|nr:hypothetical protein [Planctomycetota bacterium]
MNVESTVRRVAGFSVSILLVLCVLGSSGCASNRWIGREGFIAPDGIYVVHVPGIMGTLGHDQAFGIWLILSGAQDVTMFDWTGPIPLTNLTDTQRHERMARDLVAELHLLRKEHPSARIVVTSHSGGTRVAIRAAELLAEEAETAVEAAPPLVEQMWVIAAAVSPKYDLSAALQGVQQMYVIDSEHDWLILGLGTAVFGTADRDHVQSAGMVGFMYEDGSRLHKIHYDPWWRELDNSGGHLSALGRNFVKGVIGPIMLGRQPVWTPDSSADAPGVVDPRHARAETP